ncbi:RNA-binding motif protein, X-linked 2, related [Eimeria tenella]|uniref:RNA-binding motif protein, X-linked 2, related n=1 Tax=Eimeria tenella TaxID=5802 RepID=U6KVG0_EIMTE|nr:RNA-binding motif protein, X-linked 2, related [Eimeria tenella]CDJ42122.1 RNA-binding motif protein, X-linked 2, related [Eimeria tenella]|eukprot:XP_013232872.1 RNA-binding motif protein, X-linked 2, related [Eimeria tenella]
MALGVTGAFSNINAIQRLNAEELRLGISQEASWHNHYKDSCYIYISGLDPRLTEGDVAIVFSQWGEPIDVVLVRDQKTGVPRGFGFLGYEDQRSTILAVDNANGMKLLQRTLRVDHCKNFRPPTSGKDGEETPYQPTGAEGAGIDKYLVTKREQELHKARQQQERLKEQRRRQALASAAEGGKDVDEMWAEEFELMISNLNAQAEAEVDHLMREDKRLRKKLKKEKKKLKKEAKKRSKKHDMRSESNGRSERDQRNGSDAEQQQEARRRGRSRSRSRTRGASTSTERCSSRRDGHSDRKGKRRERSNSSSRTPRLLERDSSSSRRDSTSSSTERSSSRRDRDSGKKGKRRERSSSSNERPRKLERGSSSSRRDGELEGSSRRRDVDPEGSSSRKGMEKAAAVGERDTEKAAAARERGTQKAYAVAAARGQRISMT